MERHVVSGSYRVVGLVRLEVQAIRVLRTQVLSIVVEQNVNGRVASVLLVIYLCETRGHDNGLVVIASVVHADSAVNRGFSILRGHSSRQRKPQAQGQHGQQ